MRFPALILLLFIWGALSWGAAAQSCDLFVNASDGDDGNSGAQTAPLRSLEFAYDRAASGQRVCVAAGEYFLGNDADGIRLATPGKSVTFRLNAFAGATEVRFSEKYFVVAAGSGTITFEAGTASQMVFGSGVINVDSPAAPTLLNFLHSVLIESGTLNLSGVTARIGASVGVPGRANPNNAAKVAPDSARVRFGGTALTGNVTFLAARRTMELASEAFRLPADLSDHTLLLTGTVTLPEITLPRGRILLDGPAAVSAPLPISITGSEAPITALSGFTGSADFSNEIVLDGAFAPAGAVLNRGPGSLALAQIVMGPTAAAGTTRFENSGGGRLLVSRIVPGAWAPDLINISGTIALGHQSQELTLAGSVSNTARVELEGPVRLPGTSTLPVALNNTGTIVTGDWTLTLSNPQVQFLNSGSIDGPGSVLLSNDASLQGGGSLPAVLSTGGSLEAATMASLAATSGRTELLGSGAEITGDLSIGSGAELVASAATTVVRGSTTIDGTLSGTSPVTLRGAVTGSGSINGPDVVLSGDALQTVSGQVAWEDLTVSGTGVTFELPLMVGGALRVTAGDHTAATVTAGSASLSGGRLTLLEAGALTVDGDLVLEGGALAGNGDLPIRVGGDLIAPQGSEIPDASLTFVGNGAHDLALEGTLGALSVEASAATVAVNSPLTLQRLLQVPAGVDVRINNAVRLRGNVEVSDGGSLSHSGSGRLIITGTASSISGALSLPPLEIEGLLTTTGSTQVASLTLTGGVLRTGGGATFSVSGSAQGTGSLEVPPTGTLDLGGAVDFSGVSLTSAGSVLRFSGAQQAVMLPADVQAGRLEANGQSVVSTSSILRISDRISLTGTLDLGPAIAVFSGEELLVDGSYSGRIDVIGPAPRLTGTGIYGSLNLDLGADTRNALLESQALRLGGVLTLDAGGLNLNGGTLVFEGSGAGLALNVADDSPENGQADGVRITGGSVNPASDPFDLTWFGSVTRLFEPGPESALGPIRNLTVRITDAVNSPAVFGLRLPAPLDISGVLLVDDDVLVRLPAGSSLSAAGTGEHVIDGRVEGNGVLRLSGASSITGGALGTVASLELAGSTPTELRLGLVESLTITAGTVRWLPPARAQGGRVGRLLSVRNSALEIAARVELAGGGRLEAVSGALAIHPEHALYLGSGSSVATDAASAWSLLPGSTPEGIADGGFLVLSGTSQLGIAAPLPRLRLAPDASATSDDVLLTANLTISDRLHVVDGDLFLDRFSLLLDGTDVVLDSDGEPFDGDSDAFFGDFSGPGGDLILAGPGNITLGGRIEIASANLRMVSPTDRDSVRIRSNGAPREIVVTNKQFSLERGVLDLGLNDIVLTGSSESVFRSAGGRLVGRVAPVLPSGAPDFVDDPALFPFNDAHYGELVLGGGSAGVVLSASVTLDNVRLRGNLRLPESGRTLTVARRLAFGRDGATLNPAADGQLQVGANAAVVVQGRGVLSRRPEFLGAYGVFFDLHDGSVTGTPSGFGTGTLLPGFELTAGFGEVRRLGVLAGAGATVRYEAPLRITTALAVWAGQTTLGSSIRIAPAGKLYATSLDPASRALLTTGGGYVAEGALTVGLSAPYGDLVLSPDLLPASASVDRLYLYAGSQATSRVLLVGDRTVGMVHVRLGDLDDSFNLNGGSLTTSGSMAIERGVVTSGPLAVLRTEGSFTLGGAARVSGAVVTHAAGDASIGGTFAGLILQAGADVVVDGDLGSSTSLFFDGSAQRLVLNGGAESISSVSLIQPADQPPSTVTLTGADLAITGALTLDRGFLETGSHVVTLPAGLSAVTRASDAQSHVIGSVEATLPVGAAGRFTFPLGGAAEYRPLTLEPSGLLSSTMIRATHVETGAVSKAGLPVALDGSRLAVDTAPHFWAMTSSVNFAESQPYTVSVSVPAFELSDPDAAGLMMQQRGVLRAWSASGVLEAAEHENGRITLSRAEVRGGLSPAGSVIGIGLPETRGAQLAYLQAVNADASSTSGPVAPRIDGRTAVEFSWGQSTVSAPFEPLNASSVGIVRGTASITAPLTAGRLTPLVVAPSGRIIGVPDVPAVALFSARNQIWLAHAASDVGPVTFELSDTSHPLGAGEGVAAGSYLSGFINVVVRDASGRALVGHHFNTAVASGETIGFVLTGFETVPSGVPVDRRLQLWMVRADGSITTGEITTDAEPTTTPLSFRLHGHYPNPVSEVARITFDLPRPGPVILEVFDITGRRVARLRDDRREGIAQEMEFDASALPSGLYLYRLQAGEDVGTGRVVVLR